ncbi:hypothetical protein MUK42_37088, partial [Musa troglodytarum]
TIVHLKGREYEVERRNILVLDLECAQNAGNRRQRWRKNKREARTLACSSPSAVTQSPWLRQGLAPPQDPGLRSLLRPTAACPVSPR